jgi:hypothetical protein
MHLVVTTTQRRPDIYRLARKKQASKFYLFFFQGDLVMCKAKYVLMVAAIMVLAFAISPVLVWADWNTADPAKYVQLPDEKNGMDVNATYLATNTVPPQIIFPYQKVLADDFPCFQAGLITDIHIWGSWLNDQYTPDGTPSPAVNLNTKFKLSIHADVPVGPNNFYSHPGAQLWSWTFDPTQYTMRQWGGLTDELFYEPNTNTIIGRDTRIWQYNFNIDPTVAFKQAGATATGAPTIYWLDVQAIVPWDPGTPETIFGWKTTQPPATAPSLGDDAVFGDTEVPGGVVIPQTNPDTGAVFTWKDMLYITGPYQGLSIDMAFAITPEPSTAVMLFAACLFGLIAYIRRR